MECWWLGLLIQTKPQSKIVYLYWTKSQSDIVYLYWTSIGRVHFRYHEIPYNLDTSEINCAVVLLRSQQLTQATYTELNTCMDIAALSFVRLGSHQRRL